MIFDKLSLSESVKSRIGNHINNNCFPQASIISGGNEDLRYALAQNIARALVCSKADEKPCGSCNHCRKAISNCHPDISVVRREKGKTELRVELVRALVRDSVVLPNEAECKVYIICEAELMNTAAQNAFLKLLEEPPSYVVFILLAENPGLLLETVRSRCIQFDIESSEYKTVQKEGMAGEYVALLSGAQELEIAEFSVRASNLDRVAMLQLLEDIMAILTQSLREKVLDKFDETDSQQIINAVSLIKKCQELMDYNVGVGHVAGKLAVGTTKLMMAK